MWMWEKYTTLLHWSFITEGKQGPHNHCLITTSMRDECVLKGMRDRGQTQSGREEPMKAVGMIKDIYLKAPQGPNMSFPQYHWMKVQSLENLTEDTEKQK